MRRTMPTHTGQFHSMITELLRPVVSRGGLALVHAPTVSDTSNIAAHLAREIVRPGTDAPVAIGLHGETMPRERTAALKSFTAGETQVLVGTVLADGVHSCAVRVALAGPGASHARAPTRRAHVVR